MRGKVFTQRIGRGSIRKKCWIKREIEGEDHHYLLQATYIPSTTNMEARHDFEKKIEEIEGVTDKEFIRLAMLFK